MIYTLLQIGNKAINLYTPFLGNLGPYCTYLIIIYLLTKRIMKRALLNLSRALVLFRHLLLVFLFSLAGLALKAQCPPTINATPASANVCSGDSVLMECASPGPWQWFKNGSPIPGATGNSCYAYDAANFTVKAGGCPNPSAPLSVTLKPLPFVSISTTDAVICSGQQATLFVTTGPNVTWVWINPTNLFPSITNPLTVSPAVTTEYQVVGANTITNCANTGKVTVVVNPPLIPGTASGSQQICPGTVPSAITATASTGGNGTYVYQWQSSTTSAGSGFSNIPGANALTYQPGALTQTTWFRLVTQSPPCQDQNTNTVMVQVNPNPLLTSPTAVAICSGSSVNYHPTSNVPSTTFTWTATVTKGTVTGVTVSGSGNINNTLSLPAGTSTAGEVTYVITPQGPAPTNCPGTPKNLVVTVNPIPIVTNAVLTQAICAGTSTSPVILTSNVAGATFDWTATGNAGLSGYQASGSGNIPAMQIFSTLVSQGSVKYTITPHGPATPSCAGPSVVYTINVDPAPIVNNNPLQQSICTGNKTIAVALTSNIPTTTFAWTANAVPASITGYQASGTNTIPAQTLVNNSNVQGVVTYHIIPSNSPSGCVGIPNDYVVYVNPKPVASVAQSVINLCSGTTTNIALMSNVAGTSFSWTASAPGSISGLSDGTGNLIAQTLTNTSNASHPVTYTITPTFNGCVGNDITVVVNVNPSQVLTVVPANPTVCSGNNVMINLVGNVPGISFSWVASTTGNVTGFSNGSGSTISQTLTNNDNVTRTVVYAVNMELNGCTDGPVNFNVTVYPKPALTNSPLSATRCSGDPLNVALTGNVSGISYSWVANGTPGTTGYSGGAGNVINQTVNTSSNATGTVVYTITPTANGCSGTPADFTLNVNPIPTATLSLNNQSICSGSATTAVTFGSPVAGSTFTWTATPSGAGISGYTASGSASLPTQTINSTLNVAGTVTYTVVPSYHGCIGSGISHLVTVNPTPAVTNGSMAQTICSGAGSAAVNLLSNVAGTSFSWTATPSSAAIAGYQPSGSSSIPSQAILNNDVVPGNVTYHIIPTSGATPNCPGIAADYIINVDPRPEITSGLALSVCSGQSFNYQITSNIAGSSFTWSRAAVSGISNVAGSGNTSNINETLFNSTNNDIYETYVLTPFGQAPSNCAGPAENLQVRVRALPQVNAGGDFSIPYGTFTTLNGVASSGAGSLSYTWTPNTYISTGINTLTPQTEKLFASRTFNLAVADPAGCTANDNITVFVSGSPISAAPTAVPSSICFSESTTLSANASGGSGTYTYSWTSVPPGFTSTAANPVVSPAVTTVYTVTVDDGFNSASAPVTVTVHPLPVPQTLTGGGSYCSGGPGVVVGLAASESGVVYQLMNNSVPVGPQVSGNGSAISFGNQTLSGIYTAVATRLSTGCSKDMGSSVLVAINPLPVANAGTDQVIAYGTNTTLGGTASGGFGTKTYAWSPLASISMGENTATPKTTNLYTNSSYTLTVTDENGCSASDDVMVSLSGNALHVAVTALPSAICADASTAQLPVSVSGGSGVYTYSWTCSPTGSPAWTATLQNPTVSPDVTTIYTVVANDGFNTATASVTVLVNPLPQPFSVMGGGSYCYAGNGVSIGLSGSETNTNYQLYRGGIADGAAVTGTGSPISFGNRTAAFTYNVLATNNFTGCSNLMNGSTSIMITPPPTSYLVTGGGSYPAGGVGRQVGLFHGDAGISYQLYCDNVAIGTPVMGTETAISFGLQKQAGTYTVEATDTTTGCTALMNASVNISILPYPLQFEVMGGGVICAGQPGLTVQLSGSEVSIDYQLIRNGFPFGPIVPGTSAPLTWGPFSQQGIYEVRAINTVAGIDKMMNDSAVIIVHPSPTLYTINPQGPQCPGTIIRLNGSDAGLDYYLLFNGVTVDTLKGTGATGFLTFGPQTQSGTYTIKAVNPATGCEAMMNGSTFINLAPEVYNVNPAGILCPGQSISLSGSQAGVNYQLRWNGTFDQGAPVAGTGSALAIGNGTLPGIYSVIATNATTNCVSYMNDSSTLYPDPTAFTITPDGPACEGEAVGLNGSQPGVDYVLLLDNAIHMDTISGTGAPISFGPQLTAGHYSVIAVNQTSYCIFPMNGTTLMNDSPVKYNLLPAGIQCIGTTISLSASQTGVKYQLLLNGIFNMGPTVSGNGGVISFGPQSLSGTYTVRAVNELTGCNAMMTDSAVIDPLPQVFTTIPAGSHCAGSSIGLNGSEINYNYILVLNGSINLDTIAGTGAMLDFGPQHTAGDYSIVAYNRKSMCSSVMNGNSVILAAPKAFSITPAGISCVGAVIGLDNSEPGISYQLRWNDLINVGAAVPGNGSAISFGQQNLTGIYSVIATNAEGCVSAMLNPVVINPLPVAFNVTPSGLQCQGTSLGLDGSEVNASYILVRNGNVLVDTIPGTGSAITFGPQLTSGIYTVKAFFNATQCPSDMNGNSVISDIAPTIYSMTPAGIICAGATIGIDNSETGASYQLRFNGTINIGTPVAGTGVAISFGPQNLPGEYTAIATNMKGCSSIMTGKVEMNANPVAYSITPSTDICPPVQIGVDGSEKGVNYVLVLDNSIYIDTLSGTGAPLSFGLQTTSGTYTVEAYNATSLCKTTMNGATLVKPSPIAYQMTPAGVSCPGATIGLYNSEVGVSYQLVRDGNIHVGTAVAGTGLPISFGSQNIAGTYTVEAAGANGCPGMMSGSVVINETPVAFTLMPSGKHCAGTEISLNGSQKGIEYILFRNGIFPVDTVQGTGATIKFDTPAIAGSYSVRAKSMAASCLSAMNGSTIIMQAPSAFSVTPAGINCTGSSVGLDNSEPGMTYQLRLNGTANIGAPITGNGSAISFGIENIPGNYTIMATSIDNGCSTLMNGSAVLNPLPTAFTVLSQGDQCAGTSISLNGSQAGTDYVLVLNNTLPIDTIKGTGSAIDFGPQHLGGSYSVTAIAGTTTCQSVMNGLTNIHESPVDFNITPAGTSCGSALAGLDGSQNGVNYTLYNNGINTGITVAGTGSAISFGKLTAGTYTIKASNPASGCSVFMPGSLVISNAPKATAGADVSICNQQTLQLNASVDFGNTSTWLTSGDGVFQHPGTLHPEYIPGPGDIAHGSVNLVLSVNGTGTCSGFTTADTLKLTIDQPAKASAGGDIDVCAQSDYTIHATATNYKSITWSSSGTGTFGNGGSVTPTYHPSADDLAAGSVQLFMHVIANNSCGNVVDDTIKMSFHTIVTVDAGANAVISHFDTFTATDASVEHSISVHWTTSGSGSFDDPSNLHATYLPGDADYLKGSVVLTLTAANNAPCGPVSDTLRLTFINNWGIDFSWNPSCEATPVSFKVDAAVTNIGAMKTWLWNFGDGTTSNQLKPTHTFPGVGDYIVSVTATDSLGHVKSVSHKVTIAQYPVSYFKSSVPNCSNEPVHFTDLSHTLYGYVARWVWNYGDGSANDTIQFPDEPNTSHHFDAAGTFNVNLSITNSFGCTTSAVIPVQVIEAPVTNFQYSDNCSGLQTSFRDASYANGPGNKIQYWWNFGDTISGSDNYSDKKDATHIFSAPGTYQVTHVVRNFNDCTDTIVKNVEILLPVPVDYVHSPVCQQVETHFAPDSTAMNTSSIVNWLWDFGDGVTSNLKYSTHIYSQTGTYQVTLTVTNASGCTASKTHSVVVSALPVAIFTTTQQPCVNATVHFTDASRAYAGYITNWHWDFGDGNTQTIQHPANPSIDHQYAVSGNYNVLLRVTSSTGCVAESQVATPVLPAPVTNFDYTNTCQGSPARFTDLTQTNGGGMTAHWMWNFGDEASGAGNTSILQNPEHTYNSTGIYEVSLITTTTQGCTTKVSKTITITAAPEVDFSYQNNCENGIIAFASSKPAVNTSYSAYNWSFGDGATSDQPNPQHVYHSSGNYLVTLTVTNASGCQGSVWHKVTVLPAAVADFKTSTPACSQSQVSFTDFSAASGKIIRWEYNFGDGSSSVIKFPNNPNVSHTYANTGNFIASLVIVTENNCTASVSKNIEILTAPAANFGFTNSCLGTGTQFSDMSQGQLATWEWNFGDAGSGNRNVSSEKNPTHTYLQAGMYTVTLSVKNMAGCTDTISRKVIISAKPDVDFSFNNGCASDTVYYNSSAFVNKNEVSSWRWNFGDNATSTEADPSHIYAKPGIYMVTLSITNQNGCTNVKTHKVQVSTAPIAMFTYNTTSCSGTAVLFTDASSAQIGKINAWTWNFDDGTTVVINSPENPNITHTFQHAGIYQVSLSVSTSTGCYAVHTSEVKITGAQQSAFTFSNGCMDTPAQFTDQTQANSGYTITSWTWDFGDPATGISNTSTLQNPKHKFSGMGIYKVTLTTENSNGCSNTAAKTISVTPDKDIDFSLSPACYGIPTSFGADTTSFDKKEVSTYAWNFGDNSAISSMEQPVHLFARPGNFTVTLTITKKSGCQGSVSKTITVHTTPVAQFTTSGNCATNQVAFTDNSYSSDGSKIAAWKWDFGVSNSTADTSSLQFPTFVYGAEGHYSARLTVSSAAGCSAVKVMPVDVIPSPTAQFTYLAEPCHNGAVMFTDKSVSSQSMITNWKWEFAPGIYSSLQNPTYVFGDTDTCYNVKLTVTTANGCTNTMIQRVCIPTPVKVDINYTQACFGGTTWFSSTVEQPMNGSITSYKWNFGDPASGYTNESKLANPEHTFTRTGSFIVSLQVSDGNNCSTTRYMNVIVDALPKSDFSYSGGACDSLVKFKDETSGVKIVSWIWKFGDGKTKAVYAPGNPNVNHYYQYPGVYEVTLITQSDAGCSDTIKKQISRIPCMKAAFAVSDPVVCQKRSMKFSETSTCEAPIASWQWFFGDGTSATYSSQQPVVEHTYAAPGNYQVKMVVATQMVGGMATDTARGQVAVNPAAKAAYSFQDACVGTSTTFQNQSQNNNTTIKNYQWNFGDLNNTTNATSEQSPKYQYALSGQYDVKLVVTNTLGCTDTLVKKINIYASPSADFSWNTNCEAKPVFFSDNSASASSITNWNWKFGSEAQLLDASNKKSCIVSFAHAGTYQADLKVTDRNGCSTTVSKQVTINPTPVAAFSIVDNYENKQGQVLLNNGTINATDYEWIISNGKSSTSDAPVITFDKEGHYNIQLIALNGKSCADTLTMEYDLMFKGLYVPNALNPGNNDPEVSVFRPKGVNLKSYYIEIVDRWGNPIWSSNKLDSKGSPVESWDGTLHGQLLKAGVYIWKISAQFNDGEVWDGKNAGNNTHLPQVKAGTVTLIR